MNKVKLRGVIEYFDEIPNGIVVTLNTLNATVRPNKPKITFRGKRAEFIKENFKRGDNVTIEGKIVTRRYTYEGKNKIRQYVYGYSFERTPFIGEKETDMKTGRYEPPMNAVILQGKIIYIKKTADNLINLIIGIPEDNGFVTRVKVCYFVNKNHTNKEIASLYEGANVTVTATCQTSGKLVRPGYFINYENIVVDGIEVEEKAYEPTESADIDVPNADAEEEPVDETEDTEAVQVEGDAVDVQF